MIEKNLTSPTTNLEVQTSAGPNKNREKVVFLVRADVKRELQEGKSRFEDGDYEAARLAYERALELDPGCAIAYFYLGFTYHEMGNYELARDYYLQALELDHGQTLFLEHLARLHFEQEEYSVCLLRFQEAQLFGPLQPISYGLMGRACFEMERYPEGVYCLQRMLEMESEERLRRVARYYLILAYLRDGMLVPARRESETLLSADQQDRQICSSLADYLEHNGCYGLAARLLEAVQEMPDDYADRLERIYLKIDEGEKILSQVYCCDEEKLLHHLHRLMNYGTDKIFRVLVSLLEMSSPLIREMVIHYARKFGYPLGRDQLQHALDSESIVREAALLYMCETSSRQYLERLIEQINHPSLELQVAIARYLGYCGAPEHLPILESQLEVTPKPAVRRHLQRAINHIKRRYVEQTQVFSGYEQVLSRTAPLHPRSTNTALASRHCSIGSRVWQMVRSVFI